MRSVAASVDVVDDGPVVDDPPAGPGPSGAVVATGPSVGAPGPSVGGGGRATVVVVGNPVVGGADVPLPHAHCSWSPSLTRDAPAPTEE